VVGGLGTSWAGMLSATENKNAHFPLSIPGKWADYCVSLRSIAQCQNSADSRHKGNNTSSDTGENT